MKIVKNFFLVAYYGFAQYLPDSYTPIVGKISNWIRVFCVKRIVFKCGDIDTIGRRAYFGNGRDVQLGDHCTLGANSSIPNNTIVGAYSMVSRQTHILVNNHAFERTDIPIKLQGYKPANPTIIEDDVWIGMRSFLTPGRHVRKGTIVAAGSVLTKDFPEYSIVGGNPAKLILKSATKLFSVLLASKRPLITELADKLRLKYPLLPTISPCPTMRLEAIRSIIPISCRRYPKSV